MLEDSGQNISAGKRVWTVVRRSFSVWVPVALLAGGCVSDQKSHHVREQTGPVEGEPTGSHAVADAGLAGSHPIPSTVGAGPPERGAPSALPEAATQVKTARTSRGLLVGARRADRARALSFVACVMNNGLCAIEEQIRAKRGSVFLVLEIDGGTLPKPPVGPLTMTSGSDGLFRVPSVSKGSSLAVLAGKGTKRFRLSGEAKGKRKGTIDLAFEVPADAQSLTLSDKDQTIELAPWLDVSPH